jgi:hypothetical protein
MSRSTPWCRAGLALAFAVASFACGYGRAVETSVAPPTSTTTTTTLDRKTIRTGSQDVVVDSPVTAGRRVERLVIDAGGYVEQSQSSTDGDVRIAGRVPAAQLDSIMDQVATLGQEQRRRTSGTDVTDQYSDLEARLRSTIALRDRLRALLDRAANLQEVLSLEQQIARLQSDIDALQARLDQMRSQVELASLTVSLETKRVYGPLTQAGRGVVWLVSKLFVLR